MNLSFKEAVLRYRAKKGLSQTDMANKIGVTRQTIAAVERGESVSAVTETKIKMLIEEDV